MFQPYNPPHYFTQFEYIDQKKKSLRRKGSAFNNTPQHEEVKQRAPALIDSCTLQQGVI